MNKKVTVTIPLHLAQLLCAEPEDIKEGVKYEDVQKTARALLRLLLKVNE